MQLQFSSERFDPAQEWLFMPTHVVVENAAMMLRRSKKRVYQLFNGGKLNGGKVDGRLYISVESIQMRLISQEALRSPLPHQGVCRQRQMAFK